MPHVLVVEDDHDIASLLDRGLRAAGYGVSCAGTAEAALAELAGTAVDATIIDMMLGDTDGAILLAEMRRRGHGMPALILSALSTVEDRSRGLDAGAQDYIVKPFQMSELVARLAVQLRRAAPRTATRQIGRLRYDAANRQVDGGEDGRSVTLTEREGALLTYLIDHAGAVLTRGEIFDALWAPHGGAAENVVDVYLGYLRRKLRNFEHYGLALRTVRGRGFSLIATI